MKIYIETLGCQMNRLDSELLVGLVTAAGHEIVSHRRGADAVLYNTCSVRRHAEDKVYSRLGVDAKRKAVRPLLVGVLGCMAQREGKDLARRYPAVDLLCGPGQLHELPALLEKARTGRRAVALDPDRKTPPDARDLEAMESLDLSRDPARTPSRSGAFVRVMRGCDRFCTYCIVPFVRGPEHSRPPEHIEREVKKLLDAGRSEITLLGQTVNRYRHETGGKTTRFADLLARLSLLPGLRRLRFVTSHPVDFGRDLLEAMRDLPNVCPYIHAPAQSGSDAVLKRMNRGYTRGQYDDLLASAREIVPDATLVGDFITGFPGETDADHAASVDLIGQAGYKNAFIFKYSPRPGTPAEKRFEDDVPEALKRRRNMELLAAQKTAGRAHHQQYVGRVLEVLITGKSAREQKKDRRKESPDPQTGLVQLQGRSRGDHIVLMEGPDSLIDTYAQARITAASDLSLFGEIGRE
ncbi:MAG: tRNA (N6-isopentenyl adenosine(37)-C2)-methylthiotransferase MiaB [Phycisphaerae bacterium]|nr:tRNA (N6-isopentenyl adenosine(37)-C2)-methylthiotransferase MiaB [Phycisphaerae bacterium]